MRRRGRSWNGSPTSSNSRARAGVQQRRAVMKRMTVCLVGALLSTAVASPAEQACAQGPGGERQQTVQQSRYGAILGLPRDADKLYLPDEAYPRFPLPPGNEAYAHVDGLKMKQVVEE